MSGSDEIVRGGQSVRLDPYLVSDFKLATGEVFPVIVRRDTRLPDTYALRYLLVAHRTPGASSNTMRNVGHGLAVGLSFLEARGIDLMRRDLGNEVEFQTLMWFDSLDAIKAFTGEDYAVSHVPAAAQAVLSRFDERASHFEVLDRRDQ